MKRYSSYFLCTVLVTILISSYSSIAAKQASPDAGSLESVGKVEFNVSCDSGVQSKFNQAVAMLHHMMYVQSRGIFKEMASQYPDCAMLQWGISMTHLHPLWAPPGKDDLQQGLEAAEYAEKLGAPTQRERDYISAIKTFYTDWENLSHGERIARWEQSQKKLYQAYPDDIDAAAFYSLSHLATAPKSDKTFTHQKAAGKILEDLYEKVPQHPAAYHYLIHAYDNPMLASKAVAVSRGYSTIAPMVPHALHMPTHIFVRLGLWDDVIQWNQRSAAAALSQPVHGKTSLHYAHAIDYLVYGYMQKGEEDMAREALNKLNQINNYQDSFASAYAIVAAQARYPLERSDWKMAAMLPVRTHQSFPWDKYQWFESITYFAKGLGAARSGDTASAKEAIQVLDTAYDKAKEAGQDYWAVLVDSQRKSVDAWVTFAEGNHAEALTMMNEAADIEDSVDKHPVTPGAVLPARELLADMLYEIGRYEESRLAYEATLKISANRLRSISGAKKAAERVAMK